MASGVKTVSDFVTEVHETVGFNQIETLDIGGGLGVNFASEETTPTFGELAAVLKVEVPALFGADRQVRTVVTEFGRALSAKSGWCGARSEVGVLLEETVYTHDCWVEGSTRVIQHLASRVSTFLSVSP
jgi:diaminopimelate decarboxylase